MSGSPIYNLEGLIKVVAPKTKSVNHTSSAWFWVCHVSDCLFSGGMYGSGVFVLNPPWQLDTNLKSALESVVGMLGENEAGYHATAHVTWINEDN